MKILLLFLCSIFLLACNPDYLDLKRDKSQTVPTTLDDFDGLLGNATVMNTGSGHALSMISADEYSVSDATLDLISRDFERNAYLWNADIYGDQTSDDWNTSYQRILYCNIVLEGLEKLGKNSGDQVRYSRIKGEALFQRSLSFFNLAMQFAALTQDAEYASFGIPLRLASDPEQLASRNTVLETYDQIINDLLIAEELLPQNSTSVFRAGKTAAQLLLARVYLMTADYHKAAVFSQKVIQSNFKLLDYNTLSLSSDFYFSPYGVGNPEIIFYDSPNYAELLFDTNAFISDKTLSSFDDGDLRRQLFFVVNNAGLIIFKGSYAGKLDNFTGLAIDEAYLTVAECFVRVNKVEDGMDYLKQFLSMRYKKGTVISFSGLTKKDALDIVLLERKKGLLFRGTRWMDLRRLNLSEDTATLLSKSFKGQQYTLKPNDIRYIFPIAQDVLLNSKVNQISR